MEQKRTQRRTPVAKGAKNKSCHLCANNVKQLDYKEVQMLRRFISSYGKIAPRRRSGLCAAHQRTTAKLVKQARVAGLMPFVPR